MAIPCPTTIGEIIWYVVLVVIGLAIAELRWAIHKLITKLEELPEKYTTKKEMDEWKQGRDGPTGLWAVINKHSHRGVEGEGEVIRK